MKRTLTTLALALALTACSSAAEPAEDRWKPTDAEAIDVCQEWVKGNLKAPASAEFSGVELKRTTPDWTVRGAVDSQNSFGAMLRNEWKCTIRWSIAEEKWIGGVEFAD